MATLNGRDEPSLFVCAANIDIPFLILNMLPPEILSHLIVTVSNQLGSSNICMACPALDRGLDDIFVKEGK